MKKLMCMMVVGIFVMTGGFFVSGAMAAKTVVVAVQAPITGPWAFEGQMAVQSCKVAAELINQKGGILGGRMIEIQEFDDSGTPKDGALAAMKIVSNKDIVAAVSTYGSPTVEASSNIFEKRKMINIAYGATFLGLSQKNRQFFFRTCGRDDAQGIFFADYVPREFNVKRIAMVHNNTTFAIGVAEETMKALKPKIDSGEVKIVFYDAVNPEDRDFTPILTKLRESKPDVFYYTGHYPEGALIARQSVDIGLKCLFVGSNAVINDDFVKIAGLDVAKGWLMTQEPMPAELPYAESKEFLDAYKKKYGEIPSSPWPIYAADAVNIIAHAVNTTGSTDPDVLEDYLHNKANGVPGVTGPIGFTDQGDREGVPYLMYEVDKNGKYVIYESKKK
ncbi:MAG: branched-chain amino acid ABC transporter substrate-binding protein [Deltaproteobacteria bacterium]|nr:branched-chain amino acid ABC transporter substrate-binding protein [Deltaproteobacteria bacterium]MBW2199259.1 branched-chain amino acid ABC transporter substrate-binding protein [Deltaproteobacteria bacterium]MBW2538228.1 branched-chain amino acid ABC transporter substrate-binding protein [Deltaproteobacteria bacterium]